MCRYRTNDSPMLLLQPVKEEELYLDPLVIVYHDVVSDKETDVLKKIVYHNVGNQWAKEIFSF